LAELLVIVALIVVLAAIVLPNVLRSQISANEAAAVGSIATINRAEVSYRNAYPAIGFAGTLESLGPESSDNHCKGPSSAHACLIEGALAKATSAGQTRSGYWFQVSSAPPLEGRGIATTYVAGAAAAMYNQTGVRDFCSEEDGVVRYRDPGGNSHPATTAAECSAMLILQ